MVDSDGAVRVRPLIDVRRSQILAYLNQGGHRFREDPSNSDERFTRNRLRHRAMPLLERDFNPRLVEALARSADLFREEDHWMESEAARLLADISELGPAGIRLKVEELNRAHPALQRRVLRQSDDLLSLTKPRKSGRQLYLAGLQVERSFDSLWLRRQAPGQPSCISQKASYNGYDYRISIPAEVEIRESGGKLRARFALESEARAKPRGEALPAAAGNSVIIGIEAEVSELTVRSPRPGDRFHPFGAPGRKKLARYLMERKLSLEERSRIPLVVRASSQAVCPAADACDDEILWVAGHAISEGSRLGDNRRGVRLEWLSK